MILCVNISFNNISFRPLHLPSSAFISNQLPTQHVTERPSFGIAVSGSGKAESPKQELESLFDEVKFTYSVYISALDLQILIPT